MKRFVSIASTLLLVTSMFTLIFGLRIEDVTAIEHEVLFDLGSDDGGFVHGGENDPWDWGIPGPGPMDNPGPGPSRGRVWGSPLNGTYPNGTYAFLELPELDTSILNGLTFSFFAWYDLSTGSGSVPPPSPPDNCELQVRRSMTDWEGIESLTGSSGDLWTELSYNLTPFIGGQLAIRFLLVDNGDGLVENGLFLDDLLLSGTSQDPTLVRFSRPIHAVTYVPSFEPTHLYYFLEGGPVDQIGDAQVRMAIMAGGNRTLLDRSVAVGPSMLGKNAIEWTPDSNGQYWLDVALSGPGTDGSEQGATVFAVEPIYYDDMEEGLAPYSMSTEKGEVVWSSIEPVGGALSSSNGIVLWAGNGSPDDGQFIGECHTELVTGWTDLQGYDAAYLAISSMLAKSGPYDSSGVVIEAQAKGFDWVQLAPNDDRLEFGTLPAQAGPLSGRIGAMQPFGWTQVLFGLEGLMGKETRFRFSLSSGEEGKGKGWFIDDILVWGEQGEDDLVPPSTVEGLNADVIGDGEVLLTWNPSREDDLGSYVVYLGEGAFIGLTSYVFRSEVDPLVPRATITHLDPTRSYWAAVTAVDVSGNEALDADPVTFQPVKDSSNRPPTASIYTVFGTERRLGEDFIFDASGSTDPDDDILTYTWTLPDGSIDRGVRTRWRSSSEGKGLVVRLTVTDPHGASSNETVLIDVLPAEGTQIGTGDLLQFALCLLPILVLVIMIILFMTYMRNRKRARIRERLMKTEVELVSPSGGPRALRQTHVPSKTAATEQARVLDLVPLERLKRPKPQPSEKRASAPARQGPRKANVPPPPAKGQSKPQQKAPPLVLQKAETKPIGKDLVKVTLECPFCGDIFKAQVEKETLKKGALEKVVCPKCGRKGEIIG